MAVTQEIDDLPAAEWKISVIEGQHYVIDDESALPYDCIRELGKGASAIVEEIKHTSTQMVYARKKFGIPPGKLESVQVVYQQELRLIRRLKKHHHIVRIFASYSTKTELALILEPSADGGNLKEFLKSYRATTGARRKKLDGIIRCAYGCLANGLAFMHQQKIRHKDIKPQNILIHGDSVLYTDFGVAHEYPDDRYSATDGKPGPFTYWYCAPEVQFWEKRCWKSDVFSLGGVYFEIYAAMFPDSVNPNLLSVPFHLEIEPLRTALEQCSDEMPVVECLKRMFRLNMEKRPSAARIVQYLCREEKAYFCQECQRCLLGDHPFTSYLKGEITEWHSTSASPSSPTIISSNAPLPTLANQTSFQTISSLQLASPHSSRTPSNVTETLMSQISPPPSASSTRFWRRYIQHPSILENLGIYRHKIVHLVRSRIEGSSQCETQHHDAQVLSEENVVSWVVDLLGYGIRLSRQRPHGSIFSISTFPVVPWSDNSSLRLTHDSLADIQQAFTRGDLHPYQQDIFGESLLHLAVERGRLDVCRLLFRHGVKATRTHNGRSILIAAANTCHYHSGTTAIEIFNFIIEELDEPLDLDDQALLLRNSLWWPSELIFWLWRNSNNLGLDIHFLDEMCLRLSLRRLHKYFPSQQEDARRDLKRYLSPDMVSKIDNKELDLLPELFRKVKTYQNPMDIIRGTGSLWLEVLSDVGIDMEEYLTHQLSWHSESLLRHTSPYTYDRKIVATYSDTSQSWDVTWTCAFDHTPGHLVVVEFLSFGELLGDCEWPFAGEMDEDLDPDVEREIEWKRFQRAIRKQAAREWKARKGLIGGQSGEKLPGSWVD